MRGGAKVPVDRRVLEFALGLPPDQFRRRPWSRWLMRHALSSPGPGKCISSICNALQLLDF